MTQKQDKADKFAALRRQAEEIIQKEAGEAAEVSPADFQSLLHELLIHQIELELQNEELRQAGQVLEVERRKYADLYDAAPVGYVTLDEEGQIRQANLTSGLLLGVRREALIGQRWSRFVARQDQDAGYLYLRRLATAQGPWSCEIRLVGPEDSPFWAKLEGRVNDGLYRITLSDISDRKQAEAALRESEANYRRLAEENATLWEQARRDAETKARLLQEVNHRVRNNLAAILGLLAVEAHQARTQGQIDAEEILARLSRRVTGLAAAHDLLSQAEWMPLALSELAARVIDAALNALPAGRQVQVEVAPSPVKVSVRQAGSLALILNELATNTIKYGLAEGYEGRITVRVAPAAAEIELVYADDGPGYPPAVLAGEDSTMGLHLARQLATAVGGALRLANRNGATATLRIRVEEA